MVNAMEYRLGVLGGMGPQATNTFYQFVIDRTDARSDQEHVNALILSDSGMPDRTGAILGTEEQRRAVFDRLLGDARLLENAGCTVIAVPCNTSHFFLDEVQKHISIPILHMIRETALYLAAQGKRRPGILATDGTIQTGLYQKEFAAQGIEAVTPSPEAQKLVMSLIYDDVKAGRDGDPAKFAHPPGPGGSGLRLRGSGLHRAVRLRRQAPPASLLHRCHGRAGRAGRPGLPQAPADHLYQIN